MTESDVPTPGEPKPSVSPPSLDSEFTSSAGQLYVPRLRIGQTIVFFALVVVLIGLIKGISALETRGIKPLPHGAVTVALSWWNRIMLEFHLVSFAICLVASGILIRSRCFRMLGRLQPGHWIVLILATCGILVRITWQSNFYSFVNRLPYGHTFEAVTWFNILAVGMMFAYAAIRLHDAKRWKVLLASGSAYALYWAIPLMHLSTRGTVDFVQALWFLACLPAIFVVIALVVVFIDWPRRATRDWVHWLGVSLWTLMNLATLPTSLHMICMIWLWTRH